MQVEGLNDRMVDVDSNLNYMLGQLSLVVQEFNQVQAGNLFSGKFNFLCSGLTRGQNLTEVHSTN